jgi:hypothetical protein
MITYILRPREGRQDLDKTEQQGKKCGRSGTAFGVTLLGTKDASQDSEKQRKASLKTKRLGIKTFIGEFDPGSGRTLAACLTHASRTVQHLTLNALIDKKDQNTDRVMRRQRA